MLVITEKPSVGMSIADAMLSGNYEKKKDMLKVTT